MKLALLNLSRFLEVRNQLTAATFASMGYFISGMARAWASPGVPSMLGLTLEPNQTSYALSYAPLSKEEISWITSLMPLGALTGGLCSSFPLSRFGRKWTLMLSALLFCLAFLLLGSAYTTEAMISIMASRTIMGFSVGLTMPAAQIYVSECSESKIRGSLGSFPAVFMALGMLVTYVAGAYMPWHHLSYFCSAFPVPLFISIFFLPESPSWLITKEKHEKAKSSLTWLRGHGNVEEEFNLIRDNVMRTTCQTESKLDMSQFLNRGVLIPLFIVLSLMFFQQWCGINAVIFYTVTIFAAAGSTVDKNLATILVGVVQFIATFASIFLVDRAGRRILLIASGLVMFVSLSTVGAFFYLKHVGSHEGLGWLPLLGLVLFMVGYSLGFASVPFVLMGELFPNRFRNLLGGIASCFNLTNTFLVIKLFTNLEEGVGFYGVFWIYAICSLLSCLFVAFFLPETKGKTLEEIEVYFRDKS